MTRSPEPLPSKAERMGFARPVLMSTVSAPEKRSRPSMSSMRRVSSPSYLRMSTGLEIARGLETCLPCRCYQAETQHRAFDVKRSLALALAAACS
jgi:hypothetical protein